MKVAVIPARGGSKRIPRKNIKEFCGKPMIAWSIEIALESKCFDQVVVSTDDEEIAKISRRYGANVPFMRRKALADDYTPTIPVIKNAIEWFEKNGNRIDLVCCIYAAAPFIEIEDLRLSQEKLMTNDCLYSFPVAIFPYPIYRAKKINSDGRLELVFPEYFDGKNPHLVRSQEFGETFHDAGQFYWGKKNAWLDEKPIFSNDSVPIEVPKYRVQDIDTEDDWIRAELMFNSRLPI